MGTFTILLQVADPENRRYETVEPMVDSGATYTLVPGSILARLGRWFRATPGASFSLTAAGWTGI